jgi:hypothetical protein
MKQMLWNLGIQCGKKPERIRSHERLVLALLKLFWANDQNDLRQIILAL